MKEVPLRIEEMKNARDALNEALQAAMTILHQKNAMEANVGIAINIQLSPGMIGDNPARIAFKTTVAVPVKMSRQGLEAGSQIYWDNERLEFMMGVEGEQVKLDGGG